MRVFISWSGEESRAVAATLRDWTKKVLQTVEPWMSEKDIASGARWSQAIANNLRDSKVGVICLTPENVAAPWLHFEAGALSKTVDDAYVCPLLFRIEPSELKGPMAQFQAQRYGHDGVLRMLEAIRSHPEHKHTLNNADFVDAFEAWWPRLEESMRSIQGVKPAAPPSRSQVEMISETLELTRAIAREIKSSGVHAISSRIDDLGEASPSSRQIGGLSTKIRSMPPSKLTQMLIQWDSSLPDLLGGEQKLHVVVDAILSNQIGQATSVVMTATGYRLPEARTFVDSLTLAIARLGA